MMVSIINPLLRIDTILNMQVVQCCFFQAKKRNILIE
ncbi:unnamed protein product [Paramecium pentaurelia]|uniref:Uncharacterized protein n=1 Tax=Paramecium pentaurelia TaxID=43138 RepID=A0A8S1Y1A3_9CILI|nr:unnamed protein product [Paramecium pentaurelia]